ncbi:hypothetical protein HDU98_012075 [Podochytrium sp. JEL0797]|nr:hypothetical protein HDU98_012075 [Podochytrium sp. JEL0797]
MDDTGAAFGQIELIFLNAGISMGEYAKNCEDISPFLKSWPETRGGPFYALPYLKKAQRGSIVAMSSPSIDMTMVYPGVVKIEINRTRLWTQADIIMDAKGVMTAEQAAALVFDLEEPRSTRAPTATPSPIFTDQVWNRSDIWIFLTGFRKRLEQGEVFVGRSHGA